MDNSLVIEPTMDYDFTKLYFGPPSTLTGGAYFARLLHNTNKSLYIQSPKSLTKQGFIKSGKKIYVDLMFDNNDTIFINWIENLEAKCQDLVYSKRESWFESKLEKDDIEIAFTSPFKIFKSGKYYLLRVNVKPNIKIYDEKDQVVSLENVTSDQTMISILEIQGLKFTSRNFQIEIELKQAMIVSPDPFLDECFIKKPITNKNKDINITKDINVTKDINTDISLDELINKSAQSLSKSLEKSEPIDLELPTDTDNNDDINTDTDKKPPIDLDIKEIDVDELKVEEDPTILKEVELSLDNNNNLETMTLKKPNQVYYEIYKKAREKAKEAKKNALVAYLEMKNIKKTYMLDDIEDSDSDFEDLMEDED